MRLTVVGFMAIFVAGCQMGRPFCGFCSSEPCCFLMPPYYFRCLDDMAARHAARQAACSDLSSMSCSMSCDYKAGFEQAYVDVAMGADGQVPPFPPRKFWKDRNRTYEGHLGAQDWFAGYAAGAPRALACRAQFNVVPTSGPSGYESSFGHSISQSSP